MVREVFIRRYRIQKGSNPPGESLLSHPLSGVLDIAANMTLPAPQTGRLKTFHSQVVTFEFVGTLRIATPGR